MQVDLYTKIVLTVIAACLVAIVVRDVPIVGEANAQMRASKGPVYEADGALRVKVVNERLVVHSE